MTAQDPRVKAEEKQAKEAKEDVRPAATDKAAGKAGAKAAVKAKAGGGSKVDNSPKAIVENKTVSN